VLPLSSKNLAQKYLEQVVPFILATTCAASWTATVVSWFTGSARANDPSRMNELMLQNIGERAKYLRQVAHVLVVTSVYDLVSSVVVEALANGLPVICPDHSGFKDAITPECGIKMPASSKRHLVRGFTDTIHLRLEADLRWELPIGALARSTAYRQEDKVRAIGEICRARVRSAVMGHK
jgi:glycosyltransferase involved in cell wall biosynthesis